MYYQFKFLSWLSKWIFTLYGNSCSIISTISDNFLNRHTFFEKYSSINYRSHCENSLSQFKDHLPLHMLHYTSIWDANYLGNFLTLTSNSRKFWSEILLILQWSYKSSLSMKMKKYSSIQRSYNRKIEFRVQRSSYFRNPAIISSLLLDITQSQKRRSSNNTSHIPTTRPNPIITANLPIPCTSKFHPTPPTQIRLNLIIYNSATEPLWSSRLPGDYETARRRRAYETPLASS